MKNPTTPQQHGAPLVARAAFDSPLGLLTAVATDKGLSALWYDANGAFDEVPLAPEQGHVAAARSWMERYWSGAEPDPQELTLDLYGSLFQRAVWRELLKIPPGHTHTYGEVAGRVGNGAVPRATGGAVGNNPVVVIVPCHRVIGANGSLTGFASGLPRKEWLLRHEGVLLV
jgi:methylated-DNA-[protein]-cysteine S-methyltransferase